MALQCSQKMSGKPDLRGWEWEAESKAKTEERGCGGDLRESRRAEKEMRDN